jgi:hypothetical protein
MRVRMMLLDLALSTALKLAMSRVMDEVRSIANARASI